MQPAEVDILGLGRIPWSSIYILIIVAIKPGDSSQSARISGIKRNLGPKLHFRAKMAALATSWLNSQLSLPVAQGSSLPAGLRSHSLALGAAFSNQLTFPQPMPPNPLFGISTGGI